MRQNGGRCHRMEAQSMPEESFEQRLERLKRLVTEKHQPGRDDWRRTIGAFANDPVAGEIIDEALRIREEERRHFRSSEE